MTDWFAIDSSPPRPQRPDRAIAMVGCGGIASVAAEAYANAGFNVVALVDPDLARAESLRDRHHPRAAVYDDIDAALALREVEIVDIATHTDVRPALIRASLAAGKHVQSQKPFVHDVAIGERLVADASSRGLQLSVNQNARYSPHFAYLLAAVRQGALGRLASADFDLYWDHDSAIYGTPFGSMDDVIVADFGIHWFDIVATLFVDRPARGVYALASQRRGQLTTVPTLVTTVVDFDDAQSVIAFRASAPHDDSGHFRVDGERAALESSGASLGGPRVTAIEHSRRTEVTLTGRWMPDALAGTMGELLCAIDDDREPLTSARRVLHSVRLCLAAAESARTGRVIDPSSFSSRSRRIWSRRGDHPRGSMSP